jgi:hypothetical protein
MPPSVECVTGEAVVVVRIQTEHPARNGKLIE